MSTQTMQVADLSVLELKTIIRETISQVLQDLFRDPDEGLSLRDGFQEELRASVNYVQTGGAMLSAEKVAADLGLRL